MMRLDGELDGQYEAVQQSLLNSSSIEQVSRTSAHPLDVAIKNQNVIWDGKQTDESILFTILKAVGMLRVSAEEEIQGLDMVEHGMPAYTNS